MSKYEELRDAFADYFDAHRGYYKENEQLVSAIVDGLPAYLGIGLHFHDFDGKKKRYISYYEHEESDHWELVGQPWEAISYSANASFAFGIGVILEREADGFHKTNAILRLTGFRHEDAVVIHLDKKEAGCHLKDGTWSGIEGVHEMIYHHLQGWLQRRPKDDPLRDDIRIGFQIGGKASMTGVPLTDQEQ